MDRTSLERYGRRTVWFLAGFMVFFGWVTFYLLPQDTVLRIGEAVFDAPRIVAQTFAHAAVLPLNDGLHRLLGVSLLLLGPFQFNAALRRQRPALHRGLGRLYLLLGCITIVSALVFVAIEPFSGPQEGVFVVSVALGLVFSLGRAFWLARQRRFAAHREWMIRGYALFLFIAVQRLIFVPFAQLTDWPETVIFELTAWLSVAIVLIAAETWINLSRNPAPATGARP